MTMIRTTSHADRTFADRTVEKRIGVFRAFRAFRVFSRLRALALQAALILACGLVVTVIRASYAPSHTPTEASVEAFAAVQAQAQTQSDIKVLSTQALAKGVLYKRLLIKVPADDASNSEQRSGQNAGQNAGQNFGQNGIAPARHFMRLLEVDPSAPGIALTVLKAQQRSSELDDLVSILRNEEKLRSRKNSMNTGGASTVLGAVNASMWRAGTNTPIGLTLVEGEPVEILRYKHWSSCAFDAHNRMTIDSFTVQATMRFSADKQKRDQHNQKKPHEQKSAPPTLTTLTTLTIQSVNRRLDAADVVLYNRFAGERVPDISAETAADIQQQLQQRINARAEQARRNATNDSTESTLSKADLKRLADDSQRAAARELDCIKLCATYLKPPAMNTDVPCKVLRVLQGGIAEIPRNGFVVSVPKARAASIVSAAGTTFSLRFSTNVHSSQAFVNAISAPPRLVRSGVATHEGEREGVTSKRFVEARLPRTAIGTSADGNKIFLAVVSASAGGQAATLAEMAACMKAIGAHEALNLDGGGSSCMVVAQQRGDEESGRSISTALGVILNVGTKKDQKKDEKKDEKLGGKPVAKPQTTPQTKPKQSQ
jgi:hypothetical protein